MISKSFIPFLFYIKLFNNITNIGILKKIKNKMCHFHKILHIIVSIKKIAIVINISLCVRLVGFSKSNFSFLFSKYHK